jgi:hypothetical protein
MLASSSTRKPETVDELIPPPLAAALDTLDLHSRRVFAGKLQGERRSKSRGRSVEFEDYRQYVPGDDLRHIDWNVFARLDRFFIKIFQEEQDLALHIVLDASASMDSGSPNKLICAQRIAMALGYLGLVNNNRVALWLFGATDASVRDAEEASAVSAALPGSVRRLGPLRGRTSVQRVAKFLLDSTFPNRPRPDAAQGSTAQFTRAMKSIVQSRSGRGVMVVLSDLLIPEGYADGLSALAGGASGAGAAGWDVTLLQVLSPGELDPFAERDGAGGQIVLGDLRFTDAETGKATEVTVTAELVAKYAANLARYQGVLKAFATARGMQRLVVRSDADVPALMLDELRRRGLLR